MSGSSSRLRINFALIWYSTDTTVFQTNYCSIFQRRISREGLLNEPEVTEIDPGLDDSIHQLSRSGAGTGEGSTDPLLQIPTQLSAVLTLKRQTGNAKQTADSSLTGNGRSGSLTPLLKRKRESIV